MPNGWHWHQYNDFGFLKITTFQSDIYFIPKPTKTTPLSSGVLIAHSSLLNIQENNDGLLFFCHHEHTLSQF